MDAWPAANRIFWMASAQHLLVAILNHLALSGALTCRVSTSNGTLIDGQASAGVSTQPTPTWPSAQPVRIAKFRRFRARL